MNASDEDWERRMSTRTAARRAVDVLDHELQQAALPEPLSPCPHLGPLKSTFGIEYVSCRCCGCSFGNFDQWRCPRCMQKDGSWIAPENDRAV